MAARTKKGLAVELDELGRLVRPTPDPRRIGTGLGQRLLPQLPAPAVASRIRKTAGTSRGSR
jgi:hypothetical protein